MAGETFIIDIPINARDNTGPAFASASKNVSQFERSMQRSERQLQRMSRTRWELTIHAIDKASTVISAINRRAWNLTRGAYTITLRAADYATRPIRAVANLLTSTLGLLGIAGGAAGGIVVPLSMSGDWEQTQMAFETMLKDAQKARQFLAEAQRFAARTPFGQEEVIANSRLLMAFGFQAERILPMLETIGDTAAGLGAGGEGIERMVRALGQIQAKGRAQAEELLQLQEVGVPAAQILQEELGLTAEQVANIGSQGIAASRVIEALLTGMQKRYGGMMERQSRSFKGMLAAIKDTFDAQILRRWGDGLRLGIQPHLQRLTEWIDQNQATIERWGNTLEQTARRAVDWVVQKLQELRRWIEQVMGSEAWRNAQSPWERLQVLWDAWWSGGGEQWVADVGAKIGAKLKDGLRKGFGTAWDIFKEVQGTPGGYLLDAWLLAQAAPLLNLLLTVGGGAVKGAGRAFTWLRGLRGGASAARVAGSSAAAAQAATAAQATTMAAQAAAATGAARTIQIFGPSGQVLSTVAQQVDDVARAASRSAGVLRGLGSLGRIGGALGKVGRALGPVGAVLSLLPILTAADAVERAGAIGSAAGGWGGMAAGAAIGSMIFPGIGTAIGGLLGGLAGGFGGDWLGRKVAAHFGGGAPQASPVTANAGAPPIVVNVQVTASPQYHVEAAPTTEAVLDILRRNQKALADLLGDEIVTEVEEAIANLALTRGPRRAWGVTPL